ncbi:MAG: hypothetical protein IPG38_15745 [Chitinophagaceae bacterium]|nr:hypothetical protein [Chitinophagaceae bacterium]
MPVIIASFAMETSIPSTRAFRKFQYPFVHVPTTRWIDRSAHCTVLVGHGFNSVHNGSKKLISALGMITPMMPVCPDRSEGSRRISPVMHFSAASKTLFLFLY